MNQPHYHDTADELANLDKYEGKAKRQEDVIYKYMCSRKGENMSPEDIHKALFLGNTPITSIRRAISNLTRDGLIMMTDKKKMGNFGRMVNTWIVPMNPKQLGLWEDVIIENEFDN